MDVLSNLDLIDRSQINFIGCNGRTYSNIGLNQGKFELCAKDGVKLKLDTEFAIYSNNNGAADMFNVVPVNTGCGCRIRFVVSSDIFVGSEFDALKFSGNLFLGTEFEASSKISSDTFEGCNFLGESFKFGVYCNGSADAVGKIFSDNINFSVDVDGCITCTKCALIIQSNDGSCGVYPILIQNGSDTDTKHNNILLDEYRIYINSKCSTFINSDTSIELNSNDTKFSVDNNVVRIDNSPLLFYKGDAGLSRYIDFGTYESDTTSLFGIQIKDASQTKRLPLITFNTATSNQCSHVTNIVIAHDGTIDKTEFVAFRSDIPTVNHLEFANPIIPENCSLYEVSLAPTTFTKTPIMQLTNKSGATQVADLCYDKTSNKVFVGIDHDAQIAAGEYNLSVFGM